jgi:hypothetical protein
MKQPEIKAALIDALRTGMDPSLEVQSYHRSPKGLVYSRTEDGGRCQFAVEFASNPSYAPGSLAHITPALLIANHRISERALQLVEDPFLLANAPEVIQNRRLTMVTDPQMPEWYVADVAQLTDATNEIREVFFDLGMPFLDDYSTASGIIRQHEAGDTRALRQQHYYVYVIAAYLLEGKSEAAHALLHQKFAKPGIKRRFESLWRNMNAEQDGAVQPATRSESK